MNPSPLMQIVPWFQYRAGSFDLHSALPLIRATPVPDSRVTKDRTDGEFGTKGDRLWRNAPKG